DAEANGEAGPKGVPQERHVRRMGVLLILPSGGKTPLQPSAQLPPPRGGSKSIIHKPSARIPAQVIVLDEPQPREQFRIDRIALGGAGEQPGTGLAAWHLVHHDVLG